MRETDLLGPMNAVQPANRSRAAAIVQLVRSDDAGSTRLARLISRVEDRLVVGAAVLWFVVVFAAIVWMQHGTNPRYFSSPDETVQRHAAQLIADHGRPFDSVNQPDPDDLLHERLWVTTGDHAVPAYPPVGYYLQGGALKIPVFGILLVPAFAALAVAALVLAAARFSPSRRILAITAPLLAFPALYYLMRPWMNISMMLSCVCLALYFWSNWLESRSTRSLALASACLGLAVAIRPDYALLFLALACAGACAEARPHERKRLIVALVSAGAGAVAVNLVLNTVTVGHPFSTAYAIWDSRNGIERPWTGLPGPLASIGLAVAPYGLPSVHEASKQLQLYWLHLGPVAFLLLGQLALIPLLAVQSRTRRFAYIAAVGIAGAFVFTHISSDLFGADDDSALLRDSLTRYWSPVYLLAAIAPLVFVMRARREWAGVAVVLVVAILGARTLWSGQPESVTSMHSLYSERAAEVEAWRTQIPPQALVYTMNLDKLLWSRWDTATIPTSPDDQQAAADSMSGVLKGGRPVYIAQIGLPDAVRMQLAVALLKHQLVLRQLDSTGETFEVTIPQAIGR